MRAFKDTNVCLHVQSSKLVHVSGVHCHMCAYSTTGCDFVYVTVQYCIEYGSTVSVFQAQDLLQSVTLLACSLDASPCMPAVVLYYCTFQGTVL